MTLDLLLIVGPNIQDRLPIQGEDLGDEDMTVTHTTGNVIIIYYNSDLCGFIFSGGQGTSLAEGVEAGLITALIETIMVSQDIQEEEEEEEVEALTAGTVHVHVLIENTVTQ